MGLFLQLSGVATVVWGLRETRQLFGYPTLFQHAIDWAKRFPRYKPSPISGEGKATLPAFTCEGSGYIWESFSREVAIEKRVAAIERNLKCVDERLNKVQGRLHYETNRITSELHKERLRREEEDINTRRQLELSQTGGLGISAVGFIWLSMGLILSTASQEIAQWLT